MSIARLSALRKVYALPKPKPAFGSDAEGAKERIGRYRGSSTITILDHKPIETNSKKSFNHRGPENSLSLFVTEVKAGEETLARAPNLSIARIVPLAHSSYQDNELLALGAQVSPAWARAPSTTRSGS